MYRQTDKFFIEQDEDKSRTGINCLSVCMLFFSLWTRCHWLKWNVWIRWSETGCLQENRIVISLIWWKIKQQMKIRVCLLHLQLSLPNTGDCCSCYVLWALNGVMKSYQVHSTKPSASPLASWDAFIPGSLTAALQTTAGCLFSSGIRAGRLNKIPTLVPRKEIIIKRK